MKLVGDAAKITAQGILGAGKFANPKDRRIIGSDTPETVLIGAQRIGSDKGVAAVVLSAGDGVAIAKTIELFRIDREDSAVMLKKRFDERTTRNFYGYGDPVWLVGSSIRPRLEESRLIAWPLCSIFCSPRTRPSGSMMQSW